MLHIASGPIQSNTCSTINGSHCSTPDSLLRTEGNVGPHGHTTTLISDSIHPGAHLLLAGFQHELFQVLYNSPDTENLEVRGHTLGWAEQEAIRKTTWNSVLQHQITIVRVTYLTALLSALNTSADTTEASPAKAHAQVIAGMIHAYRGEGSATL